ncbi:TetR-like C-terminal domain-containing protein [Actinomadura sp. B10D3]|uniref:TetR-like C-terminal domain-containing protein n=1 Tax=Actinomadura sp. B10D3 TaxID=3153557 RepID=UPI00325D0E2D
MLNELVIDAYHDLRDALARAAAGSTRHRRAEQRMRELAHAYRQWAREHPHRYELLFKPPFPGYDAHAEPLDAVPSGSHLANSHGASDIDPDRPTNSPACTTSVQPSRSGCVPTQK